MPRRLGFILASDPTASQIALTPANLDETARALGVDPSRYASLATYQASQIASTKQLIPGVDNLYLIVGGVALLGLALISTTGGRRR